MTTVVKNPYANRISLGELNVGKGAIGRYSPLVTVTTSPYTIASPFFNGYILLSTLSNLTVRLPVIGYGSTDVLPGWSTTIMMISRTISTITFTNSSGATTITTIDGFLMPAGSYITMITFTAISATENWSYTTTFPALNSLNANFTVGLSTYYNTSDCPRPQTAQVFSNASLNLSGTNNINVLYTTPVAITFSTTVFSRDSLFYILTANDLTMLVTGIYEIECYFSMTSVGGATTTNFRAAIRRNGANLPAAMAPVTNTFSNGRIYTLKLMALFNAGDVMTLVAGKSVISLGSNRLFGYIQIKYIGQ